MGERELRHLDLPGVLGEAPRARGAPQVSALLSCPRAAGFRSCDQGLPRACGPGNRRLAPPALRRSISGGGRPASLVPAWGGLLNPGERGGSRVGGCWVLTKPGTPLGVKAGPTASSQARLSAAPPPQGETEVPGGLPPPALRPRASARSARPLHLPFTRAGCPDPAPSRIGSFISL